MQTWDNTYYVQCLKVVYFFLTKLRDIKISLSLLDIYFILSVSALVHIKKVSDNKKLYEVI